MVSYTSQYQMDIEGFSMANQLKLDPSNRWVRLSSILPWDRLVDIYKDGLSPHMGAKATCPRIIIGSLIIKHKLGLSDEETLQTISENPYMQYFLGLVQFVPGPLFAPSLFTEVRKRLGNGVIDHFNDVVFSALSPKEGEEGAPGNKGKLKVDATAAEQDIRYPSDLSLINGARLKTEAMIDTLFPLVQGHWRAKPRTYRKLAHKRYLGEAKKKKKQRAPLRKAIRFLLNCVQRNLGHIDKMLDQCADIGMGFPVPHAQQRQLWVIHTLYQQQRGMYDSGENRCDDRIVSIAQPHVRPIVRGKQGKSVEFGAKLGLSLTQGHLRVDNLSWDAYNEAGDLQGQAETYRLLTGHYPELIQADKIYATNANRKWCKENGIRLTATPKGKPKEKTAAQKRKEKKGYAERNAIEGRIGNAKQALTLDNIKARLKTTSQAWIGATVFVLNVFNLLKQTF